MQYVFCNQSTKQRNALALSNIFPLLSLVLDHTKVTSFSGGGRVATTEYFMAIDAGTPRSHVRALVQS